MTRVPGRLWRPWWQAKELNCLDFPFCLACLAQDPNPDDPLNKEAAVAFQENPRRFEMDVQRAIMHGHVINGQMFPPCKA